MAIEIAMTATTSSGSAGGPSGPNPMQAWWEGIAKARSRIQALVNILGPLNSLESLQDSERPAKGLLESEEIANNICTRLDDPSSGSGGDQLCQWFYETFQTGDPDLQLVVLRYVPVLAGIYLSRVVAKSVEEPLAGFEAVMLALYTAETKARGGRPLVINIPDLGQPSLYHAPRNPSSNVSPQPFVGQLSAPLEPQVAVKSTKRACIVGVALDLFFRKWGVPRPVWMAASQGLMSGGYILMAIGMPGSLYIGSIIVGICYGVRLSISVPTASELFGLKYYGMIYNFLILNLPIGSFLFSGLLAGILYDIEASKGQKLNIRAPKPGWMSVVLSGKYFGVDSNESNTCVGAHCYRLVFLVMAGVCVLGLGLDVLLTFRMKKLYVSIHKSKKAVTKSQSQKLLHKKRMN